MVTKDCSSPSKYKINAWLDGSKKISVTRQTLRFMITKGLSPQSNYFGWSWKTFCNHPNTETDTETDADHKRFFTHEYFISILILKMLKDFHSRKLQDCSYY